MKLITGTILIVFFLVNCKNRNGDKNSSEPKKIVSIETHLQEAILIDTTQLMKNEVVTYLGYHFRFSIDEKLHEDASIRRKLEDSSNLWYGHFSPSGNWIIQNDSIVDGFMIYRCKKSSIVNSLSVQGKGWKPLNFLWINDSTLLSKIVFKPNELSNQNSPIYLEIGIR